ncbi:hypothetical protein OZ410_13350 [Robiginitalea sp. M366]|uniref:hypothetical protein n=1 Tax=Robiginitalea aestuariiviva TaxID=3036903 RepID=UPI00240D33F2|nr:hypothetical protein [Robiginitalea aestuariiviva]MDG1573309.1 hypothetical protein [Robiginitalea aestuariiviva]
MKTINKIFAYLGRKVRWVVFLSLLLIVSAFVLGISVKNWPFVSFNKELGLADILDVLTTLLLAFLIPYFIKYFIDKSDKVSNIVLQAIEAYRDEAYSIHDKFIEINESGSIKGMDRDQLLLATENLDGRLTLLEKIVNRRCGDSAKDPLDKLKKTHIEYWRLLTGSEINSVSLDSIDLDLAKIEIKEYHRLMEDLMSLEFRIVEL